MDPEQVPADLPNADDPVRAAVYYVDDVTIGAVGTTITDRRRVGPGNFTPSRSQNRA